MAKKRYIAKKHHHKREVPGPLKQREVRSETAAEPTHLPVGRGAGDEHTHRLPGKVGNSEAGMMGQKGRAHVRKVRRQERRD